MPFSNIFAGTLCIVKDLMRLNKLVEITVSALEDIKGRDIKVLDVRKMTSLFDNIIVASAESTRQAKSMANNVQEKAKAAGARVHGVEGEQVGEWILVDLGAVIVHIMQPAVRQHYNLEELWTPPPTRRRSAAVARAAAAE
jgi:ribosome-associated protein